MKKLITAISLLIMASLVILFTACNSTSELLPLSNSPAKAEASNNNYEALSDRLEELESRLERLEQGLDERVIEYNMVHSAIWEMMIDNNDFLAEIPEDNFPYTNDMREFPTPMAPLYGYDKNGDGIPDTNYVPFEKTKWFYQAGDYCSTFMIQGPDLKWIENFKDDEPTPDPFRYEAELHNIQTAVMAMLSDSKTGNITINPAGGYPTYELNGVGTVDISDNNIYVSDYMTGLGDSPATPGTTETHAPKSGCSYSFGATGNVTQHLPP
jgi:hypothetical protein